MRYFIAALALLFTTPVLAKGNHFILEVEGGLATPGGSGMSADTETGRALALSFGFGGRFKGLSPAFYLVGRLGRSDYGFTGPPSDGLAHVDRSQREFGIGGRIYIPITKRMRLLGQVLIGEIADASQIDREGYRLQYIDDTMAAVFTEVGFQYRLTNNLSVGANVDYAFLEDSQLDLASTNAGLLQPDDGRMRVAVSTTFHF